MKISKLKLKQMVNEVVKEEVLKTTDLEGPYTVHVKKGRLAGQTVMANKHKVTGIYYYLNPDTGTDEPLGTENDLEVQKQQDEGVGYVYAKDRAKDPKSIPGEHWRVKFQSASDLKKHGNTEKSRIEESLFSSKEEKKTSVSKKDIKNVIRELVDEMWADVGNIIYEVSYETPSTTDATAAADHAYQERQEVLAMKRIQSYAHWGYKHAKTHPNEVVGMFKKIADEIDGLVKAHEKGKEVSPSNVKEVAPPGWEGTVKAMKKHSVGGAKKWNPKKKKEEGIEESDMEEAKKKITNPYALAWWMKNQGYKSHK
jgi:hypothetical protein